MTNQDMAFVIVCFLYVISLISVLLAWREVIEYRRRALRAEIEVRRLEAHAACAQAEIRALEDKLREA